MAIKIIVGPEVHSTFTLRGPRSAMLSDIIELPSPQGHNYNLGICVESIYQSPGTENNLAVLFHRTEKIETGVAAFYR